MLSAGNLKKNYSKKIEKNSLYVDLIKNHKILQENEKIELFEYLSDPNNFTMSTLLNDDEQFGYYLAGLIEGDGCFERNRLTICYHEKDLPSALWLKERIGYGKVNPIKMKKAIGYYLTEKEGIKKVMNLVNGKFNTNSKINQMIKYKYDLKYGVKILPPNLNPKIRNSYWLSGFVDADGCFLVLIRNLIGLMSQDLSLKKKRTGEVRLKLKISQKKGEVLESIHKEFGGYLAKAKRGEWEYDSTSFTVALKLIEYFDKYSLISTKYIEYLLWRDCYRIVQRKEHLTKEGLDKIVKLKLSIERFRS